MDSSSTLQSGVPIKPIITLEEVKIILKKVYGLVNITSIKELNGYDDKNFHICVDNPSKDQFVLKIINSLDSKIPEFFQTQSQVLEHLGKSGIKCPRTILTNHQKYFEVEKLSSGEHIVRLLEFIPGIILHKAPCSPNLFYQTGKFVAEIDEALKNFHQPFYKSSNSLWMLKSVPKLKDFLRVVEDPKRKQLVLEVIQQFNQRVLPVAHTLESGIIHGDFNEQNIIVTLGDKWKIDAVIDFGDSHIACYLFELAVTITYMIIQGKDIDIGAYVLAGYASVRNVPQQELNLLKVCVAARLCQSVVLGAYFSKQDPENSYILTTALSGWAMLEKLWAEPEEKLLEKWLRISRNFKDI